MEAAHLVRPQVFGYIRSAQYDEEKVERLTSELMAYGNREGLTIVHVFVDNGGTQRELLRPGLGALLDALNRERVAGVVLPALWHLSWRESVREYVLRQFEGIRVWVAEDETRHRR